MTATALVLAAWALAASGSNPAPSNQRAELRQLSSDEIRSALYGMAVSYSPPGWADAGVQEEYRDRGRWTGVRLGRGPFPFSGQWKVERNQLCVREKNGVKGALPKSGWLCRPVLRNDRSGSLYMTHMQVGTDFGLGPLELYVRPLSDTTK